MLRPTAIIMSPNRASKRCSSTALPSSAPSSDPAIPAAANTPAQRPFDSAVTRMGAKADRCIESHSNRRRGDGDMRRGDADQIDKQGNGQNRSASSDAPKHQSDDAA
jgi:hypothetical protein